MDSKLIGVIIGVTIAAIFAGLVKLIPVIVKTVRANPGPELKLNTMKSIECKPGRADVCIQRGEKLAKHDQILINLVNEIEESKEDRKDIKIKLDNGFQRVYDKLDRMK